MSRRSIWSLLDLKVTAERDRALVALAEARRALEGLDALIDALRREEAAHAARGPEGPAPVTLDALQKQHFRQGLQKKESAELARARKCAELSRSALAAEIESHLHLIAQASARHQIYESKHHQLEIEARRLAALRDDDD